MISLNKISSFQYSKSLFRMFVNASIVSCKIRDLKEKKTMYDVHWQIVSLFWEVINLLSRLVYGP